MLQGRSRWPNPVGFRREEGYIGIPTDKLGSFVGSQCLIHQTSVWHSLQKHAHKLQILSQSENYFSNPHHLRSLLLDRDRCSSFNLEHGGIVLDFSRQRLDYAALSSLFGNLARCYPALNTSSQFVALFLLFLLCRFSRTSWRAQADS